MGPEVGSVCWCPTGEPKCLAAFNCAGFLANKRNYMRCSAIRRSAKLICIPSSNSRLRVGDRTVASYLDPPHLPLFVRSSRGTALQQSATDVHVPSTLGCKDGPANVEGARDFHYMNGLASQGQLGGYRICVATMWMNRSFTRLPISCPLCAGWHEPTARFIGTIADGTNTPARLPPKWKAGADNRSMIPSSCPKS